MCWSMKAMCNARRKGVTMSENMLERGKAVTSSMCTQATGGCA